MEAIHEPKPFGQEALSDEIFEFWGLRRMGIYAAVQACNMLLDAGAHAQDAMDWICHMNTHKRPGLLALIERCIRDCEDLEEKGFRDETPLQSVMSYIDGVDEHTDGRKATARLLIKYGAKLTGLDPFILGSLPRLNHEWKVELSHITLAKWNLGRWWLWCQASWLHLRGRA